MVDDDQLTRNLLKNALLYCVNRDIPAFENGHSAWSYLLDAHKNTDIIVTDVEMPEMNGFQLLSKIKENYPHIKCILMSGNLKNEKSASELGADAFLAKPFQIKDLFDIVQRFVVEV